MFINWKNKINIEEVEQKEKIVNDDTIEKTVHNNLFYGFTIMICVFISLFFPNSSKILLAGVKGFGTSICFLLLFLIPLLILGKLIKLFSQYIKNNKEINYNFLEYFLLVYLSFIVCMGLIDYSLDIGCYQILRWLLCIFSLITICKIYKLNKNSFWVSIFGFIAILFNPIFQIHLDKFVWLIFDIVTLFCLSSYVYMSKNIFQKRFIKLAIIITILMLSVSFNCFQSYKITQLDNSICKKNAELETFYNNSDY